MIPKTSLMNATLGYLFVAFTILAYPVGVFSQHETNSGNKFDTAEIKGISKDSNSQVTTNVACQAEITRICEKKAEDLPDLDALECVLNRKRNEVEELSDACNHVLWEYRKSITEASGFLKLTDRNCLDEFKATGCFETTGSSNVVTCIIENKDKITKLRCQSLITRLEGVVFGDYEMIERFANKCETDIKNLKCGRNDIGVGQSVLKKLPHSQGKTIECLSDKIQKITGECAVEILRIAEWQVDDFHLDRALYFACRDDREKFCSRVQAGNGKVYKCLLRHKMDQEMTTECRDQIYRRQKLGWQDYRASGIVASCRNEIKKYKCRRGVSNDKHVRLSQILLCLENEYHQGQEIGGECLDEIKQHRRSLMEDYSVTPELLTACTEDKEKFCADRGIHGKTLHCLMAHAQKRNQDERLKPQCLAEIEKILKISDLSNDWQVDPVLHETCRPVVDRSSCSKYSQDKVLDCLLNLLATDSGTEANIMTDECETTLIQIQYFLARDFPMDSNLYSACNKDAKQICGAKPNWADVPGSTDPSRGPLVLSCLFRNIANEDKNYVISPACADRVKQTMRQRALSVHLMPDMEDACMEDLTEWCSEKTKPGEELQCLQDHLEDLDKECKISVTNFTEMEMKSPTVDPFIWKHCREFIEEKCEKDQSSEDVDLLDCLTDMKPDMKNKKCKISIEHLQLLRLKDVKFSPKFKSMCKSDLIRYCNGPELRPLTSWKVVSCLSKTIRDDIITENTLRISKGCRKQVRNLLLAKIQFETGTGDDNSVYKICSQYIHQLCNKVSAGGGRILECLRDNSRQIPENTECYESLFKVEQDTDADSKLDLVLNSECLGEIKTFCPGPQDNLLQCLSINGNKQGFDENCKKIVRERMIEQNSDARLNPRLHKNCNSDIKNYCTSILPGHGRIIGCLKNVFLSPKMKLSSACKTYIEDMMQRAAKEDVKYDSDLYSACQSHIEIHCQQKSSPAGDNDDSDKGVIEECLKQSFHDGKIQDHECKEKVAQLIQTTMIDIHVDPLLNQACAVDVVRHCEGVPPGEGRILGCLFTELNDEKIKNSDGKKSFRLSERCRELLSKRGELFRLAGGTDHSGRMDSLVDLVEHVQESPHRNYFLTTGMSIVGLIFIFGLFCGRVTKRKAAEKNK